MKLNKKLVIIIGIIFAFGVIFLIARTRGHASSGHPQSQVTSKAAYYCPMHPNYVSDKPGDCPICSMRLVPSNVEGLVRAGTGAPSAAKGQKKILFYRHPMRPDVTSPKPAKDEMGMDYVPVYEEEAALSGAPEKMPSGYAPVRVSPAKQQLIGVKTSVVEKKNLQKVIHTVGKVAYDPDQYEAQAEYLQSVKSLKAAGGESASTGREWAEQMASGARAKLTRMGLDAGMIELIEKRGEPDKSLLYAVPGGEAWVYAAIFEYEIPVVKVGDTLEIEAPVLSGKLTGRIHAIDTVVDSATRSVRVRALVKNEQGMLKPDLFVNVSLKVDLGEVLAVPEEAAFLSGRSAFVFVDKGEGFFEPRQVTLGQRAEGLYEVKEGLKEGERVVTNGNFLIDSESRMKAALAGVSGEA